MDIANITSLDSLQEVKTTDDIVVNFDKIILDSNTDSYLEKHSMSLSEFNTKISKFELMKSNFILNNSVPNQLQNIKGFFTRTVDSLSTFYGGSDTGVSLTRFFNQLQMNGCYFKFESEMYKVNTGDESFENFTPELDSILVSFKNMVISSKKFNIVFSATIPGYLKTMEGVVQSHRFFPFKIVNSGKLLFNKLTVVVPLKSEAPQLLKLYGKKLTDLIYEIDLTQFPIFDDRYIPNANDSFAIIYLIKDNKIKLRALKYVKDMLYDYMVISGLTTQNVEWARGDKLKLDQVSDAGHPLLSIKISGDGEIRSVEHMLESMQEVGEKLRTLLIDMIVTDISKEVADDAKAKYGEFVKNVSETFLENNQIPLMKELIEASCTYGTINEKLIKLNDKISTHTKALNCLELKFLNFRYSLLKESLDSSIAFSDYFNYDFGDKVGSRQKSYTYLSNVFNKKIVVNRDYVPTALSPLDVKEMVIANDELKPKKNYENVGELPTGELKDISDDFRKED